MDKALVFLAHPGNWLADLQTPFSITHNLTVIDLIESSVVELDEISLQ